MDPTLQTITEKLDIIIALLQPKPKKPRQTKIPDTRTLEEQIRPFKNTYAPKMLEDFWIYWTEKTVSGKEKWQLENVFDVSKRLLRWSRQEAQFQHDKEARMQLKNVNERPQANNKFGQNTDLEAF
jgi:hypothetical protein